jgi:hypothetical protein
VIAEIAYAARMTVRPRYHANDISRDVLEIDRQMMTLTDGRVVCPSLDVQGFTLVNHRSAVSDFADPAVVWDLHRGEIINLITAETGADAVIVSSPGLLRYSERSGKAGAFNNSRPARFAHIDVSDATAAAFAAQAQPAGRGVARFAHFNIWRALSIPPQDVPLAVCDARSVAPVDLIFADAIFDEAGKPEWSFEGLVVAHNPGHRWHWFRDMTIDEALIFKTNDSDPARAHNVPHVAFDDPNCPPAAAPRVSIEMRATAYWFA